MKNIVLNIPHSSIIGIYDERFGKWPKNPSFCNKIVKKWTDWYTDYLFSIVDNPGIKKVVFPYSRFVCDVDRLEDTTKSDQGIIYTSFEGYKRIITEEQRQNVIQLWKNHQKYLIDLIKGDTVLINCHSFPSEMSKSDICIGFTDDWSYDERIVDIVKTEFERMGYSVELNFPNSNSIAPISERKYKSVKIEVNKRVYMNEKLLILNPNIRQWMRWSGTINKIYKKLINYELY